MDVLAELAELEENDGFVRRHIGPSETELAAMLHTIGAATLDDVAGKTISRRDPLQRRAGLAAADR